MDFSKIRTYPIATRNNKFTLSEMIPTDHRITFPGQELENITRAMREAATHHAPIILMLGGAVIKEGCSLVLIDLMKRGYITHVAMNGSVSIHDFELAMIGRTSEDVQASLDDGSFGMADETGRLMNGAINRGFEEGIGQGRAIAQEIGKQKFPYKEYSVLHQALTLGVGLSVHVAIGGDIIHQHPTCNGAALGATSYEDFKILTEVLTRIDQGVVLNVGSAVIMPEVFLKALTIARNLGYRSGNFTVANFDFLDMYRPRTRVIQWPQSLGARGYSVRGRHNQTLPGLQRLLRD